MATLSDIKRRIRSVSNTQQITRAMKMIAGTRLRRAQERMMAMRPYVAELGRITRGLLPELAGDEHTLLAKRAEVKTVGLIAITSDRGLCGGLPGSIERAIEAVLAEARANNQKVVAFVSGKRGRRILTDKPGVRIAISEEDNSERPTAALAEKLSDSVSDAFSMGVIDSAHIIYSKFRTAATQDIITRQILPLERDSLMKAEEATTAVATAADTEEAPKVNRPYEGAEIGDNITSLVDAALRRHMVSIVYSGMLEGAASELGARLTAMDAATRNAGDLITELTLSYNKARQSAITNELIDIVGGVEAMNS